MVGYAARQPPGEPFVVGVRVGAEGATLAQKPGAERLVTLDMLGLEARSLGGEAVGQAQDRQLPKGPAARTSRSGG